MPYGKTPMKKKGSMMHMDHGSAMKMDHGSAMKMGHSPMKETAKQEKKNLLKDMPVDSKASAMMMKGSFMSKHSNSAMMMKDKSPLSKHCMGK